MSFISESERDLLRENVELTRGPLRRHLPYRSQVSDMEAEFLLVLSSGVVGESDGSIYGQACASKAVAVASMDWIEGDGPRGAFEGMQRQEWTPSRSVRAYPVLCPVRVYLSRNSVPLTLCWRRVPSVRPSARLMTRACLLSTCSCPFL